MSYSYVLTHNKVTLPWFEAICNTSSHHHEPLLNPLCLPVNSFVWVTATPDVGSTAIIVATLCDLPLPGVSTASRPYQNSPTVKPIQQAEGLSSTCASLGYGRIIARGSFSTLTSAYYLLH
jgi:hypothetical protein